jgi:hypothetical protein
MLEYKKEDETTLIKMLIMGEQVRSINNIWIHSNRHSKHNTKMPLKWTDNALCA